MLFSWSQAVWLLVSPALHPYVQYQVAEKKNSTELLRLREVAIPAFLLLLETCTYSMEDVAGRAVIVYDIALTAPQQAHS